jgi:hypothetical protein
MTPGAGQTDPPMLMQRRRAVVKVGRRGVVDD